MTTLNVIGGTGTATIRRIDPSAGAVLLTNTAMPLAAVYSIVTPDDRVVVSNIATLGIDQPLWYVLGGDYGAYTAGPTVHAPGSPLDSTDDAAGAVPTTRGVVVLVRKNPEHTLYTLRDANRPSHTSYGPWSEVADDVTRPQSYTTSPDGRYVYWTTQGNHVHRYDAQTDTHDVPVYNATYKLQAPAVDPATGTMYLTGYSTVLKLWAVLDSSGTVLASMSTDTAVTPHDVTLQRNDAAGIVIGGYYYSAGNRYVTRYNIATATLEAQWFDAGTVSVPYVSSYGWQLPAATTPPLRQIRRNDGVRQYAKNNPTSEQGSLRRIFGTYI